MRLFFRCQGWRHCSRKWFLWVFSSLHHSGLAPYFVWVYERLLSVRSDKLQEEQLVESLIKKWDGESVIIRFDEITGAWIIIAVHSTKLGPAIGGTRVKSYDNFRSALKDALRLGGGMTYKWAAAGFDAGGGKAVLAVPPELDPQARDGLLRRYGSFVKQHGGLFLTGPDMGTTSDDMDIIGETGAPYVFGRTAAAGGAGNPAPYTALGVFTGIQVTVKQLFGDASLAGKRVLIQGVGSVGRELIELLCNAGCEVLVSDVNNAGILSLGEKHPLHVVSPHDVYDTVCDIFAPCAVGGILREDTISRLRCGAVVGAANNQLAEVKDAERLRDRGIPYTPDFIANSGGAIALVGMETRGWSGEKAREMIIQSIQKNLLQVFELAASKGIDTDEAAKCIAEMRLAPSE
jgi:leucine dehydrogenase